MSRLHANSHHKLHSHFHLAALQRTTTWMRATRHSSKVFFFTCGTSKAQVRMSIRPPQGRPGSQKERGLSFLSFLDSLSATAGHVLRRTRFGGGMQRRFSLTEMKPLQHSRRGKPNEDSREEVIAAARSFRLPAFFHLLDDCYPLRVPGILTSTHRRAKPAHLCRLYDREGAGWPGM